MHKYLLFKITIKKKNLLKPTWVPLLSSYGNIISPLKNAKNKFAKQKLETCILRP